jgi:diguanylate cyclase (GGDEF)-like protein/PAS domain S-box-containing protein
MPAAMCMRQAFHIHATARKEMKPARTVARAAFQASATGKVKTWNVDCQNMLGYSAKEVLRHSIASFLHSTEKKDYKKRLNECRQKSGKLRTTLIHANGHGINLWLTLVPQFRHDDLLEGYNVLVESLEPAAQDDSTVTLPTPFENQFQMLLDCLGGIFYVTDRSGRMVIWNNKLEKVTNMTSEEVRAANGLDLFSAHDKPLAQEKIKEVFRNGNAIIEADLVNRHGVTTPYIFSGARIELGGKLYLCGMGLDMSKQKAQEEMLRLCHRALLASVNGIVITRHEGKDNSIVYINPAFERITGYRAGEVIGRDARFMAAPGLDEIERTKIRQAIQECRETHVVFRNLRKDGELFWNELTIAPVQDTKGEVTHFVGVINDVTASKQRTFHLEHEANHDALTGLANRNLFWDRLEQALYSATRSKALVAVVFIDLDGFKLINDTEGHEAGDEVLRAVSKRLKASVRENDTVSRLGGDEFVLILVNQPSLRFTLHMIERLRQSIEKPIMAGSKELSVGASIGVSMFPHDGASGGALLQAADAAMYHAKATGRNNTQFFSPEMKSTIEAKHELETSLRGAIEKNEMFLMFQPRVCLRTGRIIGAEALLRWRHPKRGVLSPVSFMPLAEESGLIIPLGEWVVANTCSMLQRFAHQGLPGFTISLNIALKEFTRPEYSVLLDDQLNKFSIAPSSLEIEIAEDSLMLNPQFSIGVLAELSRLGVKLAIDNFGAGFSSLSYLQKFPINHLEIDRSFIADVGMGGADAMITKTVITMGHNLDIDVVAKGVETKAQLDFLQENSCDQIQGNYFSVPVYYAELERLIKENTMLRH